MIKQRIYNKLTQLAPDLLKHIDAGKDYGKSKLSPPFIDLNLDYLGKTGNGRYVVVALSHYFEMNGDLIPDPDMQIRIDTKTQTAEAMTFQNQFLYQEIPSGPEKETEANKKLQRELDDFLDGWLSNALAQGHRINLAQAELESDVPDTEEKRTNELGDSRRSKGKDKGIER